MTFEEVRNRAKLPPPEEEHHPGPPPGWVPPPPPPEMEPECEAVISGSLRADGETLTFKPGKASGEALSDVTISSDADNESAVYARGGAKLVLEDAVIEKNGGAQVRAVKDSEGKDIMLPMLRGINSAVLANGEGTEIRLQDCQILSRCTPGDMALEAANGVFTVFRGKAYLDRVNIELDGGFGHGLYDTQFGTIYADDCRIVTTGHCASALATDNPGGDLFIRNTSTLCTGPASAGVYVDGGSHAEIYSCHLASVQGEGAALCNDGYLYIADTLLRGTIGAKIWQPIARPGRMELDRCTLVSTTDSAFIFDGGYGTVVMDACMVSPAPGQCAIEARRCPQHYDHIADGTAILKNCSITGDIAATDDCSLAVKLENTDVLGQMHHVDLDVGYGSRVVFTGDSQLATLKVVELESLSAVCPCTVTYVPTEGGLDGEYVLDNLILKPVKGGE